jgi:hypothetical protein
MSSYLTIGVCRLLNAKIVKEETNEVLYEGIIDNAPEELKAMQYKKIDAGNQNIFYV